MQTGGSPFSVGQRERQEDMGATCLLIAIQPIVQHEAFRGPVFNGHLELS